MHDLLEMHPTKRLLIDELKMLMRTRLSHQITSDDLLKISHISKGSLYHHFRDFRELIETAQMEIFRSRSVENILGIAESINPESIAQDAFDKITLFIRERKESLSLIERQERAIITADAQLSPRLKEQLESAEKELLFAWKTLYEKCVKLGWANPELDSATISVMTELIITGRVLVDITLEMIELSQWLLLVNGFIRGTYFRFAEID
jgi:AcrR family transcriptional regulator